MSRIIKSSNLIVSQPRYLIAVSEGEIPNGVKPELYAMVTEVEAAQPEVDQVRAEMEDIIQEAEEMVRDLLEQARAEASEIIAQARDEAQEIKTLAAKEADNIRQESQETGYKAGLKQAAEEMQQLRTETTHECELMLEKARKDKEAIIRSAEGDIVTLARGIAEKIVEKEISWDNDIVLNLVKKALTLLGDVDTVKILVNSREFEYLVENEANLINPGQVIESISLQPDAGITPGGAIIDSKAGSIDAQLETRFRNVANALVEEVGNFG